LPNEIDIAARNDYDLIEIFSRVDPRWAPKNYAQIKEVLIKRGYLVSDSYIGPASVVPSPDKLIELIGWDHPFQCEIAFAGRRYLYSFVARNDFGLTGSGSLLADGIHLRMTGRYAGGFPGLLGLLKQVELFWRDIVDVETYENVVRFSHRTDSRRKYVTLWLADRPTVDQLVNVLPKTRTAEFSDSLKERLELEREIDSGLPIFSWGLIIANVLIFLVTVAGGADWLLPVGSTLIKWGSNFSPYTIDGEWWRLFTSLFIHFGLVHLFLNMLALAFFGPVVERVYSRAALLLVYFASGLTGAAASIAWHPGINAAGSSPAVLGLVGYLFVRQLQAGKMLSDYLRPTMTAGAVMLGVTLFAGFMYGRIDSAAHLAGVAAGAVLGASGFLPLDRSRLYGAMTRYVVNLLSAAFLVAVSVWCAEHSSASLSGESLYMYTVHWLQRGEERVNKKFNAALSLAKANPSDEPALVQELNSDVLPFWRTATSRLSGIQLNSNSPNLPALQFLQTLAAARVHAYELFSEGFRKGDAQELAAAKEAMAQTDRLASEANSVHR
jgi:rhomboid protease GluP